MDWFLYDRDLRHERVNKYRLKNFFMICKTHLSLFKYLLADFTLTMKVTGNLTY